MHEDPAADLRSAHRRTGRSVREVWLDHRTLGGVADEVSVAGQLHGLVSLSPGEHDVPAHADEALDDLPEERRGPQAADHPARRVGRLVERGPLRQG